MKRKLYRWSVFYLVIAILLSIIMGCAPSPEAAPYPIEITDQLGRTVKLDSIPQRIISLAPSNTEILFALGLADKVVAVTDYCDYPPEAKEKPSIGGFSTPNIEEVIALSPDLIFATSIHEKRVIPQLEEKGVDVFVLDPETLDEVLAAITLVGEITGKKEEAAVLVADMQKRIKAVTDKTATMPMEQRPSTCYLVWHDPLMIAGYVTLQDELIEKAGGINIVSMLSSHYATVLTDYAKVSLETFIAANPAVIIAGAGHGSGEGQTFQYAKTESRLRDTDARKNNRIYPIDANLASRPGPRIVEALEKFAQFIHPELFTGGS